MTKSEQWICTPEINSPAVGINYPIAGIICPVVDQGLTNPWLGFNCPITARRLRLTSMGQVWWTGSKDHRVQAVAEFA